jgi:hypothetical protein
MGRVDRVFVRAEKRFSQWQATGSAAELEASIAEFIKLESILAAWDRRRIVVDWLLGTALAVRAELTQSVADLDGAIVRLRRAVLAPEVAGNDDFDGCHLMLGKGACRQGRMLRWPGHAGRRGVARPAQDGKATLWGRLRAPRPPGRPRAWRR